jgi:hypothetical protein
MKYLYLILVTLWLADWIFVMVSGGLFIDTLPILALVFANLDLFIHELRCK